jgi:hypothetical protein
MVTLIIFIFFLILYKLFFPWHFLGCFGDYNILGKNKYGETKKQRDIRFKREIKQIFCVHNIQIRNIKNIDTLLCLKCDKKIKEDLNE